VGAGHVGKHCNTISAAQLQPHCIDLGRSSHSRDLGGRLTSVHLSHSNLIHAHETCCVEQPLTCCHCVLLKQTTGQITAGPVTGSRLDW